MLQPICAQCNHTRCFVGLLQFGQLLFGLSKFVQICIVFSFNILPPLFFLPELLSLLMGLFFCLRHFFIHIQKLIVDPLVFFDVGIFKIYVLSNLVLQTFDFPLAIRNSIVLILT